MGERKRERVTREEAIKFAEYAQIMADGKPDVQEFYKLAESALRQNDHPKWNRVNDKLPEEFVPVIVCRKSPKIGIVVEQGYKDVRDWWRVPGCRTRSVTHWMPFPDPPKELQNG